MGPGRSSSWVALIATIALAGSALWVRPAPAAFPGANGRIVFVDGRPAADGAETSRLRSVRPDGRGIRTLLRVTGTQPLGGPFLPRWSPNGRRIVLALKASIITIDARGRDRRAIARSDTVFNPSWAPDGRRLLFFRPNALHVMAADGSHPRLLFGGLPGNPEVPMWAARGGRVAFEIYTSGTPTLWTARTDGAEARPRVVGGARPAFSPDGGALAFALRDRVWIMPAGGGPARAVSKRSPGEVVHGLAFSPDGRFLLIARQRQVGTIGPSRLFIVRRRDGRERVLRVSRWAASPDWQPLPSD